MSQETSKSTPEPSPLTTPWTAAEAEAVLARFAGVLGDRAALLRTPFAGRSPLHEAGLDQGLRDLITRLEPKVSSGLFVHQAEALERVARGGRENLLVTSSTGTGKSLCFWAFVFRRLLEDEESTALVCFPTQALLWSQARLLELASRGTALFGKGGPAYGGRIPVGPGAIEWTVWKGIGRGAATDRDMRMHADSLSFDRARVRLATIDKAHFSLLADREFVSRLACLVLDEAHTYEGAFGANVHYFLKRLWVACASLGRVRPAVFLSSATLDEPTDFARRLVSLRASDPLYHVADNRRPRAETVSVQEALSAMASAPDDELWRAVFIADVAGGRAAFDDSVGSAADWGQLRNLVYFVGSKIEGRLLGERLRRTEEFRGRRVVIYDADLEPSQRRRIEREMNSGSWRGQTLLATNALELGVDVEGLDACLIHRLPMTRRSLLQQIGRVGRRVGHPGLVVLGASPDPAGQALKRDPGAFLRHDHIEPSPLPLHLEHLRLRHQLLLHTAGVKERYAAGRPGRFAMAVRREFGSARDVPAIKRRLGELCGGVGSLAFAGLRSTLSRSKVPVVELAGFEDGLPRAKVRDRRRADVAWIEDSALFRDAHPEGVLIDHHGHRWRVRAYACVGGAVRVVYVVPCPEPVHTIGEWDDSHTLVEAAEEPDGSPVCDGQRVFGAYRFERRWIGYREIRLGQRSRRVSLAEIVGRFHLAQAMGEDFPFLRPLRFTTQGFVWDMPSPGATRDEADLLDALLRRALLARLECASEDLIVSVNLKRREWICFDGTPGGNGLSHTALARNEVGRAIEECLALASDPAMQDPTAFRSLAEAVVNRSTPVSAARMAELLSKLSRAWRFAPTA